MPEDLSEIKASLDLSQELLLKTKNKLGDQIPKLLEENEYEKAQKFLDVSNFISGYILRIDNIIEKIASETKREITDIPNYEEYTVDNKKVYYLDEDFKHKRPYAFVLDNKGMKIDTWTQLLVETCKILRNKDEQKFKQFVNDDDFKGRKREYFKYDTNGMNEPKVIKMENSDIYVETHFSANDIIKLIRKMLNKFEIGIKNFEIYLKADYTELHK